MLTTTGLLEMHDSFKERKLKIQDEKQGLIALLEKARIRGSGPIRPGRSPAPVLELRAVKKAWQGYVLFPRDFKARRSEQNFQNDDFIMSVCNHERGQMRDV